MVFKHRKFAPFFWTQFEGALNDNFFKNVLVVLVTYKSISLFGLNTQSVVALASGLFILPFFLFSSFAGQICDKYDKRRLIHIIKWAEVLIMCLAAAGLYLEKYELLFLVLFLMGAQSAFFSPIKYSIIPDLSGDKLLVKANAYLEMGTFVAILIGTIFGVWASEFSVQAIGIGLIGFALLGALFGHYCVSVPTSDKDLKLNFNLITSNYRILKLPAYRKDIFYSIMAISWFWFFGAGLLTLLPLFVKESLNANQFVLMLFLALFTTGIAVGSFAYERLTHGKIDVGIIPWAALMMSVCLFSLKFIDYSKFNSLNEIVTMSEYFQISGSALLLFIFFLIAFFGGIYIVPLFALVQHRSDPAIRSRIIASNNIYNALFMVLVSLLIMVLGSNFGWQALEIFLLLGVLNLFVSVFIYFQVPEFTLRFLLWMLTKVMYRVRADGLQNIPTEGPALLVCNHVTYVDWLIINAKIHRPIRFVMHNDFMKIPLFKTVCNHGKVIPIAGTFENKKIMQDAIQKIYEELKDGQLVCIFPEGSLSPDGEIHRFKKGIEMFAKESGASVIPMSLHGLWGSLFCRQKKSLKNIGNFFKFRKVQFNVGKIIAPEYVNINDLKSEVESLYFKNI